MEKGFHDPETLLLNDGVYDKLYFKFSSIDVARQHSLRVGS
jgi:hypothetical protein